MKNYLGVFVLTFLLSVLLGPTWALLIAISGLFTLVGGLLLYQWATAGTVPAADVDAVIAAKDEAWLNAPTPPLPAPSWEDDSLFSDLALPPHFEGVKRMRDKAIEAQDWDEAVRLSDQVLRLLDKDPADCDLAGALDEGAAKIHYLEEQARHAIKTFNEGTATQAQVDRINGLMKQLETLKDQRAAADSMREARKAFDAVLDGNGNNKPLMVLEHPMRITTSAEWK